MGIKTPKIRHHPVLPIVGFEVERRTGLDAKHVKGSVSNLDNLGALMGVLVIGADNLSNLAKQKAHAGKTKKQSAETRSLWISRRWATDASDGQRINESALDVLCTGRIRLSVADSLPRPP
jgi:hypothetical protein